MLNDEIRNSMKESVLCWLATATNEGVPNVSPKDTFVPHGHDCILIANIGSPGSVAHIKQNPYVCVSFVEVFKRKGFKLRGKATIVEATDPDFAPFLDELRAFSGEDFPIQSIIKVVVEAADPIMAPSYWLPPETTVENQIDQAMETYGVRPKS